MNLTQLLVGSEGTLAVIVEATMRLRAAPSAAATVVANFPTTAQAIDAVLAIRDRVEPCLVELMDRTTIAAVDAMTHMGLDESAGALLLIQCDGSDAAAEAQTCADVCTDSGATEVYDTDDPIEGEEFMQARRVALTALERQGSTLLDDLAVPIPRLPEMLSAIERIAAEHSLVIGTSATHRRQSAPHHRVRRGGRGPHAASAAGLRRHGDRMPGTGRNHQRRARHRSSQGAVPRADGGVGGT